MRRILSMLCVVVCAAVGGLLVRGSAADAVAGRAHKLQFSSIVLDTHDDTTQRFFSKGFDLGKRNPDGHIDIPRMRVRAGDRPVELTPTEFQLVAALARSPGRIFTRAQLLDAVHGVAFESYERAIDAHVKNIRRKLEPDPREPRYLLTVHGVGYRFADDES